MNEGAGNIAYYGMQQIYLPTNFAPTFAPVPHDQVYQPCRTDYEDSASLTTALDGHHLYLCKDNFEAFTDSEINNLKEFLVSEIFKATESSSWAPNFMFKGIQTPFRYEMVTNDPSSKDWLIELDFSLFTDFNVLVYTDEELWYERAAVWLPGHSRCRNIDPLTKLKLQNKKLEGISVGKWKFVKKVVNIKGIRLYVDVPPSAARVLETTKVLSYELQQVNIYLKSVAVDKNAFDAGLNEESITDQAKILQATHNSPMPKMKDDTEIVKIALKGSKSLSLAGARKIKEMVIYQLYRYLQQGGTSRTDFVGYGLVHPCYFGIRPANEESKKWLFNLNIGKLNKQPIIVIGAEENRLKYFTMTMILPYELSLAARTSKQNMPFALEKIKSSNRGVKGLNFNLWKPCSLKTDRNKMNLVVDVDVESVETLAGMNFVLDYFDEKNETQSIKVNSEYKKERLLELIDQYKAEQSDSYVVANMDIESSDTDDDVICLGEESD